MQTKRCKEHNIYNALRDEELSPAPRTLTSYTRVCAHQGVSKSRDSATNGFIFQQTMVRIKDPTRTLDFYTRVMGMT